MLEIKLAKLPDRTPVKVIINVPPDLYQRLAEYATAYAEAYGQTEPVSALIPAMLTAFLDADRAFLRRNANR
jgi:hypothetical protein